MGIPRIKENLFAAFGFCAGSFVIVVVMVHIRILFVDPFDDIAFFEILTLVTAMIFIMIHGALMIAYRKDYRLIMLILFIEYFIPFVLDVIARQIIMPDH